MSPVDASAAVRSRSVSLLSVSLGKKILMAVSGLIAFGYVIGHMLGNLQIFMGRNQLNSYAEFLHSLGPILWVIRLFLFSFFVIHVWKGIQLKLENYSARPEKYRKSNTDKFTCYIEGGVFVHYDLQLKTLIKSSLSWSFIFSVKSPVFINMFS